MEQQEAPKTLAGFKTHPLYLLQRNIGKYQAITPGTTPCGMHKCGALFCLLFLGCGGVFVQVALDPKSAYHHW